MEKPETGTHMLEMVKKPEVFCAFLRAKFECGELSAQEVDALVKRIQQTVSQYLKDEEDAREHAPLSAEAIRAEAQLRSAFCLLTFRLQRGKMPLAAFKNELAGFCHAYEVKLVDGIVSAYEKQQRQLAEGSLPEDGLTEGGVDLSKCSIAPAIVEIEKGGIQFVPLLNIYRGKGTLVVGRYRGSNDCSVPYVFAGIEYNQRH